MRYEVEIIPTALEMLGKISNRRIRQQIASRIDHLVEDADQQGKPLYGQLVGYRTLRAVGQRYRIIYRIENGLVIVLVVAIGLRKEGDKKDIYVLAQRLLKLGLLE
ncbi:MAG: type II toxin-antitoxin system RelE/ParE family toxin [Chloroflexi bacterium]|nr:type II toxin-antitoxin system RelE/ParE family toxin [Chloroflexota bacterium]